MFFDSWMDLTRTAVIGVLSYALLVLLLRVSGKRTLSKMNAFDLVVTIALGSTLSSVLLDKQIALLEGLLGFVVLVGMQWLVALMTIRSRSFEHVIKSNPTLLFANGTFLEAELRDQRIAQDEVMAAIRQRGFERLRDVGAVVLETDGSFSVLGRGLDARVLEQVRPTASVESHFGPTTVE
jgi:uncharacterized membrane protein YcaP (DUF421 family)